MNAVSHVCQWWNAETFNASSEKYLQIIRITPLSEESLFKSRQVPSYSFLKGYKEVISLAIQGALCICS